MLTASTFKSTRSPDSPPTVSRTLGYEINHPRARAGTKQYDARVSTNALDDHRIITHNTTAIRVPKRSVLINKKVDS